MSDVTTLYGLCASGLIAIGIYGFSLQSEPLRRIISFNLIGTGVFLLFGVAARRAAAAGFLADPVPHAMVITGIVVAFAATALTVALILRLAELNTDPEENIQPEARDEKSA